MASYHFCCKSVGRSTGRSAVAAAAYRSAQALKDRQRDVVHDYSEKQGVVYRSLWLPTGAVPEWPREPDKLREQLWNAAEEREVRCNARVAREFEIALPHELTDEQRQELANGFAKALVQRHGIAVDVSIHRPDGKGGDKRNHHAHVLCTTRRVTKEGLQEKTREFDRLGSKEVAYWRERWAEMQNECLKCYGHAARVDHRTLEAQGITREPQQHKGPAICAIERRSERTGEHSYVQECWAREREERQAMRAREVDELQRQRQALQERIHQAARHLEQVLHQERVRGKLARIAALEQGTPRQATPERQQRLRQGLALEKEREQIRQKLERIRQLEEKERQAQRAAQRTAQLSPEAQRREVAQRWAREREAQLQRQQQEKSAMLERQEAARDWVRAREAELAREQAARQPMQQERVMAPQHEKVAERLHHEERVPQTREEVARRWAQEREAQLLREWADREAIKRKQALERQERLERERQQEKAREKDRDHGYDYGL